MEARNANIILVGKLSGRRTLFRRRRRWEDNIKMDVSETGYENWSSLELP
jgi:hypothetical protein